MNEIYKDPNQPIDERVKDLLGRMTLKEKVGQLLQLDGRDDMPGTMKEKFPGSFLHLLGEDTKKAIILARESRLGIPLILGIDAIHGHSFYAGATIFPTQLAMACSWNEELIEKCAEVTAREMRNTGMNWTFSPVLCLSRDLRWGRTGETFGEDPYLIGRFGKAMIRGYQGEDMASPDHVMATAKHYAGYSETQGGRDASEADLSQRKLRSYFLPPFKEAAEAGCGAFMTGYQSIEGLPSTANPWLLRQVLREEWGFQGLLVTDWDNVGSLVKTQKICADYKEAAALAVKSGNDMMMTSPEFFQGCLEAIEQGLLEEELLDEAVKRVLSVKFRLGLFEDDRYPDIEESQRVKGCPDHRLAALELARQSAVLLRNQGILPLKEEKIKRIAVIGPNADDDFNQLGDWSLGSGQARVGEYHPREATITLLDGIRSRFKGEVLYSKGCGVKEPETQLIEEAVINAQQADAVVVVLGDQNHLIGEFCSTATLELQGGQLELMQALVDTGKELIVVLVNSKPLALPPNVYNAAAVIELFNPGMEGGRALAELLFGDYNPSGKLTISFPYHVGQQPIFYSQVRGQHGDRYADMTQQPLYAFGEGMSYTSYSYGELTMDKRIYKMDETIQASVKITNTGSMEGVEIVQAYVSDLVTSATWVDRELKAYQRVQLQPGESKMVNLQIEAQSCSLVNASGERVVEPGEFELLIGPSSRAGDLKGLCFSIE
ncbi:MAG: glycoside hydrolase family 3 C-terminal domain-containing protein [Spirochaetaceae bacterium]|jgi:beta-glucosidase|nr:glycoside hydrolase family 3 C-terminal domain-containing protein [Spirochaetaceae bacterium]